MSFFRSAALALFALGAALTSAPAQRIDVTVNPSTLPAPATGRVFVFFATTNDREPRLQAGSYGGSVPFFGKDVDQWRPGTAVTIDAKTLGFPFESLSQMPAGDYYAQAMLVPYTKFSRADGHVIWVHNDQWEGQRFNSSPGNIVSTVERVHWDPRSHSPLTLALTHVLPPATVPADTRWVKHIKIKSELLSKFWVIPCTSAPLSCCRRDSIRNRRGIIPRSTSRAILVSARHSDSPSRAAARRRRNARLVSAIRRASRAGNSHAPG